jgi:hypothetical protein
LPMGSRSSPSRSIVSPKPPPPDPSGRHQELAIAPWLSHSSVPRAEERRQRPQQSGTRHGICARRTGDREESKIAEMMMMPRCVFGKDGKCAAAGKRWYPFSPDRFSPYASRQRWVRTFNDAFLTDHFQPAPGTPFVNNRDSWRLAASGAYSGAFHPTAEGQAAVADAVLLQARCVLLKTGGVSQDLPLASELYAHCK